MSQKVVWTGKTEVEPNFWGLNRESKGLGFNMTGGGGHSESNSPLATLFWGGIVFALSGMIVYSFSTLLFYIYAFFYCCLFLYLLVVREIKYYQLAKNTIYEITEDEIIFHHNFLGLKRKKIIPFSNIKLFHLVKYQVGDIEKGTIYIYTKTKVKTFDIRERARNTIPKIEMITDYQRAYQTLLAIHKNAAKT